MACPFHAATTFSSRWGRGRVPRCLNSASRHSASSSSAEQHAGAWGQACGGWVGAQGRRTAVVGAPHPSPPRSCPPQPPSAPRPDARSAHSCPQTRGGGRCTRVGGRCVAGRRALYVCLCGARTAPLAPARREGAVALRLDHVVRVEDGRALISWRGVRGGVSSEAEGGGQAARLLLLLLLQLVLLRRRTSPPPRALTEHAADLALAPYVERALLLCAVLGGGAQQAGTRRSWLQARGARCDTLACSPAQDNRSPAHRGVQAVSVLCRVKPTPRVA